MLVESFDAHYNENAKVLILGSMPGRASLDACRYYAHPRNAFWPIMAGILGSDYPTAYEARLNWLIENRIALWDVLRFCQREGSLDSNIRAESEVANDIPSLVSQLPELELIVFNGQKAMQLFNRHLKAQILDTHFQLRCLPSTSPANAATSIEQKLMKWRAAIKPVIESGASDTAGFVLGDD